MWAQGEYSGPAILSRGAGQYGGFSSGIPLSFRWFVGAQASYYSDLYPVGTDADGNPIKFDSLTTNYNAGMYVNKNWRRSSLAAFYRASYSYFTRNSFYSGLNQSVGLNYSNRVSRRVGVTLFTASSIGNRSGSSLVGISTPGYLGGGVVASSISSLNITPENDVFNARGYNLYGGASVTFIASPRLSFSGTVSGSGANRHASSLISSRSVMGQGDMAYRLSRNQSVSLSYGFFQTWYPDVVGMNRAHFLSAGWSIQLDPRWSLGFNGGAYRMEAEYLHRVAADPIVAELLGIPYSIEVSQGRTYRLAAAAALSGNFRDSSVSLEYTSGASPGNSIFYGGPSQSVRFGYSYKGFRRFGLHAGARASQLSPYLQQTRPSRYFSANAGTGFRLISDLHFTTNAGVGRAYQPGGGLDRTFWFASAGLTFSPGETPLVFW